MAEKHVVSIRHASTGDLRRVNELDDELFKKYAYPYFVLRQMFSLLPRGLLVAEYRGFLVGYLLAGVTQGSREGWILSVGVKAAHRRQGIGQKLMEQCLLDFNGDCTHVLLTVDPANIHAVHLYERLGFIITQDTENYFGENERRYVMSRKVETVV